MICNSAFLIALASQIILVSGYQMYNEDTEICCSGSVSTITATSKSCCGSTPYDEDAQACCADVAQPFPVEDETHYACCGKVAYSHSQYTCCGGTRLFWGSSVPCCSNRTYDVTKQECCEDQSAFNRKETYECCGGSVYYEATTQDCCATEADGDVRWRLTPRTSNKTECCGLKAYNYRDEVCCDDELLLPKPSELAADEWGVCCGGVVITDHATQLCCDGAIVTRDSDEYSCCGAEGYNHVTQTCCGVEILDNDSDEECCWEVGESYDPQSQACCGSEVVNLNDDEIEQLGEKDACCAAGNSASPD